MYVIGGDQTEYQPVVLEVSAQFAVISIDRDSVSWLGGGKDPVYGSTQTVVLTVENNGLVEAGEVVVGRTTRPPLKQSYPASTLVQSSRFLQVAKTRHSWTLTSAHSLKGMLGSFSQ